MVRNDNASSRRRPCERDDTEPVESLLETTVDWLVCFMVECLAVVENQAAMPPPFVFVLFAFLHERDAGFPGLPDLFPRSVIAMAELVEGQRIQFLWNDFSAFVQNAFFGGRVHDFADDAVGNHASVAFWP